MHVCGVESPLCCGVIETVLAATVIPQPGVGETKTVWPARVLHLQPRPRVKSGDPCRNVIWGEYHNTVVFLNIILSLQTVLSVMM